MFTIVRTLQGICCVIRWGPPTNYVLVVHATIRRQESLCHTVTIAILNRNLSQLVVIYIEFSSTHEFEILRVYSLEEIWHTTTVAMPAGMYLK